MRVLLLDNRFKKRYRNLALMKFSTYYKGLGYEVDLYSGIDKKNTLKEDYEIIIYSTIFTFHFKDDVETILYYKEKYPNADLKVGGISATLMPNEFFEATGIKTHIGIDETIDCLPPDYTLYEGHKMYNISEVFTSRGCKNNCKFCAVRTLEPIYSINPNWKDSITSQDVMIHDNNLTTGDMEHFKEVMTYLKAHNLKAIFDNGFDCRYINDKHFEHLKGVRLGNSGLRMAFDNMSQEGYIQKAIKKCLDIGISKSKIMVYILFNYNDTFEEAMYRAEEVKKLGARPYPQQYRPLDDVEYKPNYISPNWDRRLLRDFRFYWLMPGIYTKRTWDEYIKMGGYKCFK